MSIVTLSLLKAHIGKDEILDPNVFGSIASANDELLQHYIDAAEDHVANRLGNGRGLKHCGHPILRHHFDSVVAVRSNDGRVKALQDKKTNRIDGADAAAMAVFRAALNDNNDSAYNDPDNSGIFIF